MKKRLLFACAILVFWVTVSVAQIKIHDDNHVSIGSLTKSFGLQVDPYGYTLFEPSIYPPYAWMNLTHAPNTVSKCYIVQYGNTHTFFVYGNGQIYSNGSWINSDFASDKNITPLDSALSKVLALRGVYYELKELKNEDTITLIDKYGYKYSSSSLEMTLDSANKYINQKVRDSLISEKNRKYIGLVAAEVEKIVPELVRTTPDGSKAISYYSITGLLIEAIKEQQNKIEKINTLLNLYQEHVVKILISNLKTTTSNPESKVNEHSGFLSQNQPNPFYQSTKIRYKLPEPFKKASIFIFDLQGTLIKEFLNLDQNHDEILISGSELKPGMYFYSLIIDGLVVDTKSMILTN